MQHWNLVKAFALSIVLVLGIVPAGSGGGTARAEQTASSAEDEMMFFYKNPNPARVAYIIADPTADLPGAQPPILGFLAAAFQRYPNDIDRMIPANLTPRVQGSVIVALRIAGQDARAQVMAQRLTASGVPVPDLARFPANIDVIQAVGPSQFDFLWGASFATGDPKYCSKILARVVLLGNADGNAEDMLAVVKTFGTKADLHWIVTKRGEDKAREIIIVASGMWALASNAKRHVFVRKVIDDYLNAHPDEPTAKALRTL